MALKIRREESQQSSIREHLQNTHTISDTHLLPDIHELLVFMLNLFSIWLHSNVCITQNSTSYTYLSFNSCTYKHYIHIFYLNRYIETVLSSFLFPSFPSFFLFFLSSILPFFSRQTNIIYKLYINIIDVCPNIRNIECWWLR